MRRLPLPLPPHESRPDRRDRRISRQISLVVSCRELSHWSPLGPVVSHMVPGVGDCLAWSPLVVLGIVSWSVMILGFLVVLIALLRFPVPYHGRFVVSLFHHLPPLQGRTQDFLKGGEICPCIMASRVRKIKLT